MNTKIWASFMLAFSFSALAQPTFKSVTYYGPENERFRVETVKKWPHCKPGDMARKIFLDKPNELREVAYWDEKGKMIEAGASNRPEVTKKVNEIFAGAQAEDQNPCLKPTEPGKSGTGVEQ